MLTSCDVTDVHELQHIDAALLFELFGRFKEAFVDFSCADLSRPSVGDFAFGKALYVSPTCSCRPLYFCVVAEDRSPHRRALNTGGSCRSCHSGGRCDLGRTLGVRFSRIQL